jgi:hypothetical protein
MKKKDTILKYSQYIRESSITTAEVNISSALKKLKDKLEELFVGYEIKSDGTVLKYGDVKDLDEKKDKISFSDLGVELNYLEETKNSVKLQFSDGKNLYDILFYIDLEGGLQKDKSKNFNIDEIEGWQIKMKKYSTDTFELIGGEFIKSELNNKKIKLEDLVGKDKENKLDTLLYELKLEFDEFSGADEEFQIEVDKKK